MKNAVIIGYGPAGISSAVYLLRAGFKVTLIGRDYGALGKAEKIENYYGFPEPITGEQLAKNGIAQARRLGAEIITDEIVGLGYEEKLAVKGKNADYHGDVVIIATGSSRSTPPIKGIKELEGKGVSYCAVCDAFFYRGKDVVVLGEGEYALHEALELAPVAKSVKILTLGKKIAVSVPEAIEVVEKPINQIVGEEQVEAVEFTDCEKINADGVFVAIGVAGSTELARKIGAPIDKNKIVVDSDGSTGIPGIYAVGDCTGGLLQIAKAVDDGAKAGMAAAKYLRTLK